MRSAESCNNAIIHPEAALSIRECQIDTELGLIVDKDRQEVHEVIPADKKYCGTSTMDCSFESTKTPKVDQQLAKQHRTRVWQIINHGKLMPV
jgi:hypothetical protein